MSIYAIIAAVLPSLAAGYAVGTKTGKEGWLEDHNYYRCMHNAAPLYWDDGLANKAQKWAEHLASINSMVHSKAYDIFPYSGENLAMGYKDMYISMSKWYTEYDMWKCSGDWRKVQGKFGHFTAMVWKGIDRLGCGVSGKYYVCEYGSSKCQTNTGSKSTKDCWGGEPSNLPNFNSSSKCGSDGKACVDCINNSKTSQCAAMITPVYFNGSTPATTTTTTPMPTSSPITTSTRIVTTPSGEVISDEAVNRMLKCTPAQLQAANQKCKALGRSSFCQILDQEPACFGYASVDCSC